MRIVAALGGNALLRRGERSDIATQRANMHAAASAIAALARQQHELIVTHGNGPQVGLLALQAAAYPSGGEQPLDVLGAESEGLIGYMLELELANALPQRRVATLLTQTVVSAEDPAFRRPTKPVGPVYAFDEATELARQRGWAIARDGESWRRVVPSPQPQRIVEVEAIRLLAASGVLVICVGGGGVPVVVDEHGFYRGVEAVIDKDLAAAELATALGADLLLLLTDVGAVMADWGTPQARPLGQTTVAQLRAGDFAEGSMGPKVEAICRFVEGGGARAAIGALADACALAEGRAGTQVRHSGFRSLLATPVAGGGVRS